MTDDMTNRVQAVLEERAWNEFGNGSGRVIEWAEECIDSFDVARILSLVINRDEDLHAEADRLLQDYQQWRVANPHQWEEEDIIRDLEAEDAEVEQCRADEMAEALRCP